MRLYCFISSFIGSYIIKGTRTATKFTVITSQPDELTAEIMKSLKHGATKINAVGSFSNDEKVMLICVINRHQIVEFKDILKKFDNTFAFSETVDDTYGNFKQIKK